MTTTLQRQYVAVRIHGTHRKVGIMNNHTSNQISSYMGNTAQGMVNTKAQGKLSISSDGGFHFIPK
jgi:hypothetical protein